MLALLFGAGSAPAATVSRARSDREAMAEAQQAIPFDQINDEAQARIWDVVSDSTIYRRMPGQQIECDADLYIFLVRHPEVVVSIWDLMGITNVSVQRTGAFTMKAADGAGTTTELELIYGSRQTHLIFADGYYQGSLLRNKIPGKCVLLLRTEYRRSIDGKPIVTSDLDVFVKLEHAGADLLAKTLFPLVGRTADYNFTETSNFVGKIHQAAQTNTSGVRGMGQRLTDLTPTVRAKFLDITTKVGERFAARFAAPERLEIENVGAAPRPISNSQQDKPDALEAENRAEPTSEATTAMHTLDFAPRRTMKLRR